MKQYILRRMAIVIIANTLYLVAFGSATSAVSVNAAVAATSDKEPTPDWSFRFAIDSSGRPIPPGKVSPKAFGYGICRGTFQGLVARSGYLDWGAQSACTASNNLYYLHRVRVELYDSCLTGICLRFEKTKVIHSPSSSNYSRIATANGHDYCRAKKPENSRTYEQRVFVTIRDIDFGPFAQQSGIRNCDINP
jgi:hypothetical protein